MCDQNSRTLEPCDNKTIYEHRLYIVEDLYIICKTVYKTLYVDITISPE